MQETLEVEADMPFRKAQSMSGRHPASRTGIMRCRTRSRKLGARLLTCHVSGRRLFQPIVMANHIDLKTAGKLVKKTQRDAKDIVRSPAILEFAGMDVSAKRKSKSE